MPCILDRFIVTFSQPNYVYIDDITVESSVGELPEVTKTWRLDDHGPETLEVVLDRPIALGGTKRFVFNTAAESADSIQCTLTEPIPASSEWTIAVTCLLLLTAATLVWQRQCRTS